MTQAAIDKQVAEKSTVIHVRIEKDIKRDVEQLFDAMGMNISTAVNMFFRQALMEQGMPFHSKIKRKSHITLKERLKDFDGHYEFEECGTGSAVGNEVIK